MARRAAGKGLASPRLLRRLAADPVSGMGKRARHGGFARSHSPYFESQLRRLITDAGLSASSAEDVAIALRSRFPEFRRYKLDPFA
ncbi:hypothetical protein OsI_28513 [Oryza sativa Indica Group]|uniref:Cell division control protein-like n=3 Tax=Oryza TaxID=4527 RepID=Q6ZA19_ORYSJ|nr:hypothetical protein OsI_28513 [Oryza sativa Indica Group]EAZ42594.1 hypothetical protein OsJ_27159 [Oryza sativa Japonica Group]BAD05424.1 cell division control protein-like [Oryza sativa Japonica Group]